MSCHGGLTTIHPSRSFNVRNTIRHVTKRLQYRTIYFEEINIVQIYFLFRIPSVVVEVMVLSVAMLPHLQSEKKTNTQKQIHKHKYTIHKHKYTNTNTQIQIQKYTNSNTQTQIQLHNCNYCPTALSGRGRSVEVCAHWIPPACSGLTFWKLDRVSLTWTVTCVWTGRSALPSLGKGDVGLEYQRTKYTLN